jgi:hypothetical protein
MKSDLFPVNKQVYRIVTYRSAQCARLAVLGCRNFVLSEKHSEEAKESEE